MTVTDVLGRTREPDRVWPDGSYNCPFCWAAVKSGGPCPNPACHANPAYPVERARQDVARAEQAAKEKAEREALEKWRREHHEQQARERAEQMATIAAEANKRGACMHCALKDAPWRVKYVKHRNGCPRRS